MSDKHIFLIGPMGAGKSSVSKGLCDAAGYTSYMLATPIKQVTGIAVPWLENASKSVKRGYMQQSGKFLRKIKPNPMLWWGEKVLAESTTPIVIEDGRTLEEAEWSQGNGIKIVVLTASEQIRKQRLIDRDGFLPDVRTFNDKTEQEYKLVKQNGLPHIEIDTGAVSFDETVREILRFVGQ